MTPLILAFALFASAYGCGRPAIEPEMTRVVNGEDARPNSWPWQISLQYERNGYRHTCGGSLVASNWVMTAAHCIDESLTYQVVVGKHNLQQAEDSAKAIRPVKIIVHRHYNPVLLSIGNDIAMIKLSEHVQMSDEVQLACLPAPGTLLPHNYPCYITGWGVLSTGGPSSDTLQQALMPVVEYDVCKQNDWWGVSIRRSMVCAGGDGVVGGCNGDSGGPLNCKNSDGVWEVHGIASFVSGRGCNYIRKPTVFTRVSDFNEWVDEVLLINTD
ncbi:chymotrypsin-like elastase family member 2A [Clupea harengus]|uniref:Chymotrypsin-like elastase family member 2A n=1 Tax=Clupea harengus TaxID=7950 RepID=A0A6P8GB32_CLUHA|nr:chymotrypsin-like elastase family member 2A [Clupea harengus]